MLSRLSLLNNSLKQAVFGRQPAASSFYGNQCARARDGKRLVTDGPFAETREQLGGYY